MKIKNKKIELTEEENKLFIRQFKMGIVHQLHKDKLLSNKQLNEVIKSINK